MPMSLHRMHMDTGQDPGSGLGKPNTEDLQEDMQGSMQWLIQDARILHSWQEELAMKWTCGVLC